MNSQTKARRGDLTDIHPVVICAFTGGDADSEDPTFIFSPSSPLSGWGGGGGGPASEPGLARVQSQALHLPHHHAHRAPAVADAAWRQETGVCWRVDYFVVLILRRC